MRKLYYGNGLIYEKEGLFESETQPASDQDISREVPSDTATELKVYHYNNIGSTMLLTDANGNVTNEYIYGAYGELLSGDTDATNYLYNGKYGVSTDDNGMYYMRARYYNPQIKRFVNQDTESGELVHTQSLNLYSYVQGNPVSLIDPFGLSPVSTDNSSQDMEDLEPLPETDEFEELIRQIGHTVLAGLSMIPGYGIPFGLIDAGMYLQEGDGVSATLSALGAVLNVFGTYQIYKIAYTVGSYGIAATTYISGALNDDDQTVASSFTLGLDIVLDLIKKK